MVNIDSDKIAVTIDELSVAKMVSSKGNDVQTGKGGAEVVKGLPMEGRQVPSIPSVAPASTRQQPRSSARIESVDILRGMAMAVMVLVDVMSTAYPHIDHAPWNGLHIADFVMPFFLYLVGFSCALAHKKLYFTQSDNEFVPQMQKDMTKRAVKRFVKLFLIGLLLQGRWFFTMDLSTVRIMGILQRIALVYVLLAFLEIWSYCGTGIRYQKMYYMRTFCSCDCHGHGISRNTSTNPYCFWLYENRYSLSLVGVFSCSFAVLVQFVRAGGESCEAREWYKGLDFNCNIAAMIDTFFLGKDHVYHVGPPAARYGFDPEGILTTIGAVMTGYAGLHCGRYFAIRSGPWSLNASAMRKLRWENDARSRESDGMGQEWTGMGDGGNAGASMVSTSGASTGAASSATANSTDTPSVMGGDFTDRDQPFLHNRNAEASIDADVNADMEILVGSRYQMSSTMDIVKCFAGFGIACWIFAIPILNIALGIPHNKRMWSLTYGIVMASYATLLLLVIYCFHDILVASKLGTVSNRNGNSSNATESAQSNGEARSEREGSLCSRGLAWIDSILLKPFMYLGTNAMLFYVFSDSGGVTCLITSSVVSKSSNNHSLVYFYKKDILMSLFQCKQFDAYMDTHLPLSPQAICDTLSYAGEGACPMIMVYAMIQIFCWIGICYYLYNMKWFWKV